AGWAGAVNVRMEGGAGWGAAGGEEVEILRLPGDEQRLALPAPEVRITVAGHLGQHALAAGNEVELDEIAEELDEDDLAPGGVVDGRITGLADLDGRCPDRDECRLADGPPRAVPLA